MNLSIKQTIILLAVAGVIILIFISLIIFNNINSSNTPSSGISPTPNAQNYNLDSNGKFRFTPLAITSMGNNLGNEIEKSPRYESKKIEGQVTTYTLSTSNPGISDEIKTTNGKVIFESTYVFNKDAGIPPKLSVYTAKFGKAEQVLDSVSSLGKHISAHIYAKNGFTLFINRYTNTVYSIQQYIPMTLGEYKNKYPLYLQPAPEYPEEKP